MNREFERHIQEAIRRDQPQVAELFENQQQIFNALVRSGTIFELPIDNDLNSSEITVPIEGANLVLLGDVLKTRRMEKSIPRAALARSLGISTSYMWIIETTHSRKNGEPSRPSQSLTKQWGAKLEYKPEDIEKLLVLAGYIEVQNQEQE